MAKIINATILSVILALPGFLARVLQSLAMARWPRNVQTTLFTYLAVFLLFPALCWLAYAWVRGWLF